MLSEEYIHSKSSTSDEYLDNVSEEYKAKWNRKVSQVSFTKEELDFLSSEHLPVNIMIISAEWCSDCQAAVPIVIEMARKSNFINLFIIDKDEHEDKLEGYEVNGGIRVPFVHFLNNQFQELDRWVERSTLGYHYLLKAKKKAASQNIDDYKKLKREFFATNSENLFTANKDELFNRLIRAVTMRAATASLMDLKQKVLTN